MDNINNDPRIISLNKGLNSNKSLGELLYNNSDVREFLKVKNSEFFQLFKQKSNAFANLNKPGEPPTIYNIPSK